MTPECVVVGAGFSGLAAARALLAAGVGTVVLEARDRPGGRCENAPLPGGRDGWSLDLGAGWTGDGQHRLHALAAEFEVDLVEPHHAGETITTLGGQQGDLDDECIAELVGVDEELTDLASTIPDGRPWDAPDAVALDGRLFGEWLDGQHLSRPTRDLIRLAFEGFYCVGPADISLLHAAYFCSIKGGFMSLVTGKDTHRMRGGTFGLAERLAVSLGDAVLYRQPVRAIGISPDGLVVTTDDVTVATSHVVIAVPPPMISAIEFVPGLPSERHLINSTLALGSGYKIHAVYESPFWRSQGLSGAFLDAGSPISGSVDVSPPQGRPGVVIGYGSADWVAQSQMSPERRREVFLGALARHLGPEALAPVHYEEKLWAHDPWSRGDVAVYPPGFWTTLGPHLRPPVGAIHWAGTETATAYPNEIEGALEAGARAAAEVIAELRA